MGGPRLTLGTVPYLNGRPLTLALESSAAVDLRVHPPSRLARMLEAGELDAALVSTPTLFSLPGARYAPGVGIVSDGPVGSIRLYCRKPADALARVGLDSWSLAAANMTRVLLKRRWGVSPEFVPIDPETPPREDASLDAFLLIGDNALHEPPGDFYVLDLGEEWRDFTGLPFVYALWVFRPGVGGRAESRLLRAAKEEGLSRREEIAAGAPEHGVGEEEARRYLTECIRYDVGPREEEGLLRYYGYLVEDGLAPPGWEPRRLPEAGGGGRMSASTTAAPMPEKEPMPDDELAYAGIHDLAGRIRARDLSPVDLIDSLLGRIEALNPKIFAFIEVTAESARAAAKEAEAEIAGGNHRGPLHGIPFGAKDIIATAGIRTTNGSSFFRDNVPAEDAECIARLKRAGAILIGKCNTHEFAAATTTVNPHYGTTHNPWDLDRITGGSSGGSAAAVAAGLCPAALGSDTGGSIRNPAAVCGVFGLKPTYGRVSLSGVCPNVLSLDHLCPMTRRARDAAHLLQGMAGYAPGDHTSRNVPVPDYTENIEAGVRGMRIALCPDFYNGAEVDAEVGEAFERAVEALRGLGAEIETLPWPHFERVESAFRGIAGAEFAEFHRPFYEKNPEGYGADVAARMEAALEIGAGEYVRALRDRRLLRREAVAFFRKVDALILPAVPNVAPPIETLMASVNGVEF
ncbi:MAG: MqnA/MqnD/SBP family protein, partial [bacterium]